MLVYYYIYQTLLIIFYDRRNKVNKVIGWGVVVGATKVWLENKVFRVLAGFAIMV
jgi:hypothetical protein